MQCIAFTIILHIVEKTYYFLLIPIRKLSFLIWPVRVLDDSTTKRKKIWISEFGRFYSIRPQRVLAVFFRPRSRHFNN